MEEVNALVNEAADAIEDAADDWEDPEYEPSAKDANDLRQVASLVRAGSLTEARKLARSLDTVVRDQIPSIAWPFVGFKPVR